MEVKGMAWRVALSILMAVGWLAFVILWLFFWAGTYTGYQNIAVVIISILIVLGILGAVWATFGLRMAKESGWKDEHWQAYRRRGWFSAVVGAVWVIFLIIWLWAYAADFSIYQNLAVFIVSLLIVAGLNGAVWAIWGIRHGGRRWF
jgi:hypothetical protein